MVYIGILVTSTTIGGIVLVEPPLLKIPGSSPGDHVEPGTPRVDALVADSHEAMATISPSHDCIDLGRHAPSVRLPKLSLKKFNGNLIKWMTFWNTFESSAHNNPTLSGIDKFNYLNSLLESEAADAISGLTLTAADYEEAVTTLKWRFGNKQLIVNQHMDLLHLAGLRHLFDVVESNVKGLRALGIPSDTYGGLLSSILMSKLPPELRIIISRELPEANWDLDSMMKIIEREVEAREHSVGSQPVNPRGRARRLRCR